MLNKKVTSEHLYDSLSLVTLTCMSWIFTFSVIIEQVSQTFDLVSFGLLLSDAHEISGCEKLTGAATASNGGGA